MAQQKQQGAKQAQIAANRAKIESMTEEATEVEGPDIIPAYVAQEAPKNSIWIVDGCGGIYKKAAELYKNWPIRPTQNESKMIAAFIDLNPENDVLLVRDLALIEMNGLEIIDEIYVHGQLVLSGEGEEITTHPYLAEIAGDYPVNHLMWGDEKARSGTSMCRCLTVEPVGSGEAIKIFVQKFYVCK